MLCLRDDERNISFSSLQPVMFRNMTGLYMSESCCYCSAHMQMTVEVL